ncbi:MAG: carbonic anhydrase [Saprospiraceae bacterium]
MNKRFIFQAAYIGLSMWGVACTFQTPDRESSAQSPAERLRRLEEGAARFASGKAQHPRQALAQIHETANGQRPFAIVVACSDSRVSPEIIFDQGLGDLFVLRTAGNLIGDLELGSIEYAVRFLGASVIVVLGHTECGAVKALVNGDEVEGRLHDIVAMLAAEEEQQIAFKRMGCHLDSCIQGNILHGVRQVEAEFADLISAGKLLVVPMLYDVHKGSVATFSEADLAQKFSK